MQQLQGIDASFIAMETTNTPMHIGSILIYNPATAPGGFVRFKDILGFMERRMQLSRTMRQRLVKVPLNFDHPYWIEDPDFDLEYHVRHIALPKPGDWRQLCIQAARIFSRPLDLSRPPWEFTIVEGLDNVKGFPPGCYAMVTKIHHAAIDGASGIDLVEMLHTPEPVAPPLEQPDTWKPDAMPSLLTLLGNGWVNAMTSPAKQLETMVQVMPGVGRVIKGLVGKKFSLGLGAPRTRFNVPLSPNRVVDGCRLPLGDIKAIRALSPGSKVNDVFLTIVGGALRNYLSAHSDLPDKSMTAAVPISVRSTAEKGTMGNQVAMMACAIGSDIEDPAERLRFVHSETLRSKAMTDALDARNMSAISNISPALFMALGSQLVSRLRLTDRMGPAVSTVVTNVPGPTIPLYSAGARLESMIGLLCLSDGMGLGHVVQSYVDEATITFTADRKLMPDPEFYADCILRSFEELLAAAQGDAGQRGPGTSDQGKSATKPRRGKSNDE